MQSFEYVLSFFLIYVLDTATDIATVTIATVVIAIVAIATFTIATVSIATVVIETISMATVAIATITIATVAIETTAIETVSIATVNLTTVTVATGIRSFKVLLGGVIIDSRCVADHYPPVPVGGGGLGYFKSSWGVLLSILSSIIHFIISFIILSNLSSEVVILKVIKIKRRFIYFIMVWK